MESYSIDIRDGCELELARYKESSSYSENSFSIFLLSSNSNTLIFKVHDVLY